jgi:uncharacterized membrane protein
VGLNKLATLWSGVRDSLWFVPGLLTLLGVVLAFLLVELDARGTLPDGADPLWLYTGSSDAARGVLTAIASGLITVTGVVFSVTIVALQLASTQYTPRVLRNFTADRASQVVLGVFIGTFTYALLVLRVVRGDDPTALENGDPFIPHLSIVVAVVLSLVSIGFLIFFIDHLARSIQASTILHRVTGETLRTMERLVPGQFGEPAGDDPGEVTPAGQGTLITTGESGYVQAIDHEAVSELLRRDALTIRMERHVGEHVLPGSTLATVWPALGNGDEHPVSRNVREAYHLGPERTPVMDLEHGVIELVDIALKALSPSVNDPTTAVLCLDRLTEVLLAFARHEPAGRVRRHDGGRGTLILRRTEFDHLTDMALDQIRHFGVGNPRFAIAMLDRLTELGEVIPATHRRTLARHAAAVLRSARMRVEEESDRRRIEDSGARALALLNAS